MPEIDYELLGQMIDCVSREVSLRYAVYPKRVAAGKMTAEEAQREQRLMYGVKKALQKIYDGKAPLQVQQALFDTEIYKKKERSYY